MRSKIRANAMKENAAQRVIWRASWIRHQALIKGIIFLANFGFMGLAVGGSGFPDEGNILYSALNQHLISKGVCKDNMS